MCYQKRPNPLASYSFSCEDGLLDELEASLSRERLGT